MNPIALNWTWFTVSFVAYAVLAARWFHPRAIGGQWGSDPRPAAVDGGPPDSHTALPPGPPGRWVDPVSGDTLNMDTALPWFHQGKVHFFASETTLAKFVVHPASYVYPSAYVSPDHRIASGTGRNETPVIEELI